VEQEGRGLGGFLGVDWEMLDGITLIDRLTSNPPA
jgi:hypothetical protein